MMTTPKTEEKEFTLRVLIDSQRNRVLYAEADSDFVDVLFSFMMLPLGTILRHLERDLGPQEEAIGSLNNLYDSLKKLSSTRFWTEEGKQMLLNPRNPPQIARQKLKINIVDTEPVKYYKCDHTYCPLSLKYHNPGTLIVSTYNVARCCCGKLMTGVLFSEVKVQEKGGFTFGLTSFIIRDNLLVMPNLAGSGLELLRSLGIKHMSAVQERSFAVGLKEIISLLNCSLFSNTPLSDTFLDNRLHTSEAFGFGLSQMNNTTADSRKMVLKVFLQKTNNKVLFAQAEDNFIDFLFSILAIPLGSVVSLLSGNTPLESINNLYKSISCLETGKYLKSEEVRNLLLYPKLPLHHLSKNQIFDLGENPSPELSYQVVLQSSEFYLIPRQASYSNNYSAAGPMTFKDPKLNGAFVRGPAMYMVTDDLEVTPFSSISSMNLIKQCGISLDDVEEVVLNVGTKEALGILKASLSTSSALTNGLNPMLMKQPKQEA